MTNVLLVSVVIEQIYCDESISTLLHGTCRRAIFLCFNYDWSRKHLKDVSATCKKGRPVNEGSSELFASFVRLRFVLVIRETRHQMNLR